MGINNKDLIAIGFPKSALLPGNSYWKKEKTFKSSTSIWNLENVRTSKSGSTIELKASRSLQGEPFYGSESFYGKLGNISIGSKTVKMSRKADKVSVVCLNENLSSGVDGLYPFRALGSSPEDDLGDENTIVNTALSLFRAFDSSTGATLDLGDGNNIVVAGLGKVAWEGGISISDRSRLLGGTGNDIVKGSGKRVGIQIAIGGTISLGAGNDIIEGVGNGFGISVDGYLVGGSIDMGAGNDRLTGIGEGKLLFSQAFADGIYSNGWIDMGDGDDEITGTSFRTNGAVAGQAGLLMGNGDDKLIAPLREANAPIDFGSGVDRLYISSGQCEITDVGGGWYSLSSPDGGANRISGLEFIVSRSTGAEYAFTAGTLTVS